MTVGRKKVPTELARLRGNPRQHRLPTPDEEPQPEITDFVPEPPEWLGDYGKKEWQRVAPYLWKNKLLTEADIMAFATYCQNVDLLIESTLSIQKDGHSIWGQRGQVRNPALASFTQATTALRAMASEFGMTPSSRARIKLPDSPAESLTDLEPTIEEQPE